MREQSAGAAFTRVKRHSRLTHKGRECSLFEHPDGIVTCVSTDNVGNSTGRLYLAHRGVTLTAVIHFAFSPRAEQHCLLRDA
mgnify:CR=1 FL=1